MSKRIEFLDIDFDALSITQVEQWLENRSSQSKFGYIVTPNVDHVVRFVRTDLDIRDAYSRASLCICDSRVLARLARLAGVNLPVAPGSDLVATLFARILRGGDHVCLIGGKDGDGVKLVQRFPGIIIKQHVPPMGLRNNKNARASAVEFAARSNARFILLAVGSPQQELLAWEMEKQLAHGTALCIGASVEFLIGDQLRAPKLFQKLGIEWGWRLATQPRRLARRYLVDGPAIFPMTWRWWRAKRERQS